MSQNLSSAAVVIGALRFLLKTYSKVFSGVKEFVSSTMYCPDIVILDNESLFHEIIRLICQNIIGVHEKSTIKSIKQERI